MLYLVRPYVSLQWNDLPSSLALEPVTEHEVDLAKLDWDLSDYKATTQVIRLAIRHGVACSTGIVLPGVLLSKAYRPSDLLQIHQDVAQSRAKAQTPAMKQFMESIMPGWIKRGEELDARIDQSKAEFLRKANEGRAKLLAAAPQPELVAHWESLGGADPQQEQRHASSKLHRAPRRHVVVAGPQRGVSIGAGVVSGVESAAGRQIERLGPVRVAQPLIVVLRALHDVCRATN